MKQVKIAKQTAAIHPHMSMERRRIPRVPVSFGIMYSGINGDDVLMGDGTVMDLSKSGLGIRGNHPVRTGMELTLLLYLPDGEDPLFILEARVAWIGGRQFGVEIMKRSLQEGDRLHAFLRTQSVQ
jgi:hypothetical protein